MEKKRDLLWGMEKVNAAEPCPIHGKISLAVCNHCHDSDVYCEQCQDNPCACEQGKTLKPTTPPSDTP